MAERGNRRKMMALIFFLRLFILLKSELLILRDDFVETANSMVVTKLFLVACDH